MDAKYLHLGNKFPTFLSAYLDVCAYYTYLLFGIPVGFAQAVPNTVVLNKIIAAIYIFLYQDIQYRTNGITVHCSLSRLEPMQQYVMYCTVY